MLPFNQTRRNLGKLLATGQLTSYGSGTGVDDGALRKGIVKSYTVLTLVQYSGNTNITINGKTDVHANACVFDNNTGLMWSRTRSASVGPASNGILTWTTTGVGATAEGIFPYCAAANAARLAGYSDWRIPNIQEFLSICNQESNLPDATAFPVWTTSSLWSSTTQKNTTTNAMYVALGGGYSSIAAKTITAQVPLVRG